MIMVLLGPPGAGKGTQAKVLAQRLKLVHISTGDILRQNVAEATNLGKQAKDFMDKGMLVPDELVTHMLSERLKRPDVKNGCILDGYPRNLNQAKVLDNILKESTMAVDVVVYLDTSAQVIIQRLSGRLVCRSCGENFHAQNMPPKVANICDKCHGALYQRSDDNSETIKQRLTVYKNEVRELAKYYHQSGKLERVVADEDAGVVLDKILQLARRFDGSSKV
jgi:adenylate kinase